MKSLKNMSLDRRVLPAGMNSGYQTTGIKEKKAYRKGFEAAVKLLSERWGQETKEEMITRANIIMEALSDDSRNYKSK